MMNILASLPFANDQSAVLVGIFAAASLVALLVLFALIPLLETRRRLKTMSRSPAPRNAAPLADGAADAINAELQGFYETFLSGDKNSLRKRLIQAGYFNPGAIYTYNMIRFAAAVVLFAVAYFVIVRFATNVTTLSSALMAAIVGGLGIIVPNFVLDRKISTRRERYRHTFPDFVDMMVVCADAGLSIEAAANRVTREYLTRDRAFGIHLGVMMLEVRAGKRLRDALHAMAERIELDEAKTLAMLFKQSEELGVSLTKALRTHSREMRQLRLLRAEEKANVLPVKMLMPMGAFIFPVTLIIVLVPVLIKLTAILKSISPGA